MVRYIIKRTHFAAHMDSPDWIAYTGKSGICVGKNEINSELTKVYGYTGEKSALRGLNSWKDTVDHLTYLGEKLILELLVVDL